MYNGPQTHPLEDLLRTSQDFDATDPRDKVFALLGLARDRPLLGIKVDYHASVQDIYGDATRAICTAHGSLDILTLDIKPRIQGLPTWARDFSATFEPHVLENGGIATLADLGYAASGDRQPTLRRGRTERELCVGGKRIDEVKNDIPIDLKRLTYDSNAAGDVKNPANSLHTHHPSGIDDLENPPIHFHVEVENFETIYNSFREAVALREGESIAEAKQKDGSLLEALWLVLEAERAESPNLPISLSTEESYCFGVWKGCRVPEYHFLTLAYTSRLSYTKRYYELSAGSFVPVLRASLGRSFFVSEKGHFGICPKNTRPGDVLAVVFGASVTFVLKPNEKDSTFSLVGGCYIHGFMEGEALDLDIAPESFTMLVRSLCSI